MSVRTAAAAAAAESSPSDRCGNVPISTHKHAQIRTWTSPFISFIGRCIIPILRMKSALLNILASFRCFLLTAVTWRGHDLYS